MNPKDEQTAAYAAFDALPDRVIDRLEVGEYLPREELGLTRGQISDMVAFGILRKHRTENTWGV